MSEESRKYSQPMLWDTVSGTGSQGLAAGPTPYDSPVGPTTDPAILVPVPANPTPQRAKEKATTTPGTSGRNFTVSSASVALQFALANRLMERLDLNGSMEYQLTWKRAATPWGRRYCLLRARGRPTQDTDCSGWPTCKSSDSHNGLRTPDGAMAEYERKGNGADLPTLAALAGWPTANATDHKGSSQPPGRRPLCDNDLPATALLACWGTPSARDGKDAGPAFEADPSIVPVESRLASQATLAGWPTPMAGNPGTETYNPAGNTDSSRKTVDLLAGWQTPTTEDASRQGSLEDWRKFTDDQQWSGCRLRNQVHSVSGTASPSSPAATEKPGVLNPAFSLWLMGYPVAWAFCAGLAIASFPRSRRRSSRRSSTPKET